MRQPLPTDPNPVLDFGIDKADLRYIGNDLQRPECILAEPDGSSVVRRRPRRRRADRAGRQPAHDHAEELGSISTTAGSEAARYLEGTLPNGLAFARNGDFLISNFGTDCLE